MCQISHLAMLRSVMFGLSLLISSTAIAQLKGPIEATVGDSKIKMEYGNNANAPKADQVVIDKGSYQPNGMEWIDSQWSWITWWEANKHHYLKPATPPATKPDDLTQPHAALLKVLSESSDINLLSAATLALGRMQAKQAVEPIIKLRDHEDYHVQRTAWIALALIGDEAATKPFMDALLPPASESSKTPEKTEQKSPIKLNFDNASAWIIGIGLMKQADKKLLDALSRFAINDQDAVTELTGMKLQPAEALMLARLSIWSIRIQSPTGVGNVARRVLDVTVDRVMFDESIQILASEPTEPLVLNVLTPIYHSRPAQWREVPKALGLVLSQWPGLSELDQDIASMRTSTAVAYDNIAFAQNTRMTRLAKRNLARTYNPIAMPNTRAPKNAPDDTTLNRLFKYDNWLNNGITFDLPTPDTVGYALRFGLIPLGKLGDAEMDDNDEPEDAKLLSDILLGSYSYGSLPIINPNPFQMADAKADPSRAFAALAMGLYLRRLPADNQQIRHDKLRSHTRYMERLLARIAADNDEPSNLRAACLLGLGLSQTQTAGNTIKDVLSQMNKPDTLIASFACLSLGMLNDTRCLELAKQAFRKTANAPDLKQLTDNAFKQSYANASLIGQTAIIDGIACMSNPKANVLLYPRMLENPITAQSMIRAMKWADITDTPVLATLLNLLEKPGKDERVAPFAAWAMGELFDPNPVPVMTEKLLRNRNLTLLKQDILMEGSCSCPASSEYVPPVMLYSLEKQYLQEINPLLFNQIIRSPRG